MMKLFWMNFALMPKLWDLTLSRFSKQLKRRNSNNGELLKLQHLTLYYLNGRGRKPGSDYRKK